MKIYPRPAIFFTMLNWLFFLLMCAVGITSAIAAKTLLPQAVEYNATADITLNSLHAKMESITARQGIDEALKSKVLSTYQAVQDNLENIQHFKERTADFKQAITQAPNTTKKLQKEIGIIQAKQVKPETEDFTRIPTEELAQRLIIEKGKISGLDEQIKKLETELAVQNNRPQLIRQEILTAQQELEGIQKQLQVPPTIGTDSKLEIEATQVYQKTLIDSRAAELKELDVEALSNPARVELLKTQWQLLVMQKDILGAVAFSIEGLLTERREQEAKEVQNALSQVEKELSGKHPVIQAITRQNIQYSRDLQAITAKIDNYNKQKARIDTQSADIENDFKSAEKKISLAGVSPVLGKILREQRRNLLTQNQFTLQSELIQGETATTSLEGFKVEDNLKSLYDVDTRLQEIMAQQVDQKLATEQRMMIQAELRVLLDGQKELLNKLSGAYTRYLRTLGDFDFSRQQMLVSSSKFAAFLDERLLWVPSSEPINAHFISELYHSAHWLLSPSNWAMVLNDTLKTASRWPFLTFLGMVNLGALLRYKNWAKQQVTATSDKVGKFHTDRFHYTVQALALTLLLVLPLPLFLYYFGLFLSSNVQASDFSKAIGVGLRGAAAPLFLLQFFYRLLVPTGIACQHFQWQQTAASLLRSQLGWLRFIAVSTVFIIGTLGASKATVYSDSLGRLALIISMVALAVFFGRVLNPTRGVVKHAIAENAHSGWVKLRYLWYPAFILIPLVIVGFAVAGYYLSALELQQKLIVSLRLIFLVVVIHEMVYRWLTLVNRQLAMENVRQRRKSAALSEKQQPTMAGEDPVLPLDEQLVDIPKINAQTIRLLNLFIGFGLMIGFWMIWKNILPAFSFLDNIALWQHKVNIDNQESTQPITLTNLMLAGLYVFITVVSVRNFSGVMELLLFRRLSMEAGGRYAVNQLAKYSLVSISFICVANELGGSWSQVQWLVAALSVGLGFGLQEIFANLVSGIILLFESPIRVGDTITIGEVTGKVSRIQMRATTLIDWDQKEHVVPNKTFITSQLVNWTLTDAITRLVIQVGIAFDSDIELAHQVMTDTIKSIPKILEEPAPTVLFSGFGDSSLKFTLYVYVSEMANRLPVTHDLHIRLLQALRHHKIEIPFPQQDIHVRSVNEQHTAGMNADVQEKTGGEVDLSSRAVIHPSLGG